MTGIIKVTLGAIFLLGACHRSILFASTPTRLGQASYASVITKREDNSLFNAETGKTDQQDVAKCERRSFCAVEHLEVMAKEPDFTDIDIDSDRFDSFDKAFAIVAYALTENPDRVSLLFSSSGDRGYVMSCFDPINHERETITVNFEHAKKYAGDMDVTLYQDNW